MKYSFSFNTMVEYKFNHLFNFKVPFNGSFTRSFYYKQLRESNNFMPAINYYFNSNNISENIKKGELNIYQGHHGNKVLLDGMDYILPGVSFLEKKGSFLNIYNVLQKTSIVFTEPKLARNDLDIFKVLNNFIIFLRKKKSNCFLGTSINGYSGILLEKTVKHLISDATINLGLVKTKTFYKERVSCRNTILYSSVWENYYKTNLITYSSKIMGDCTNNLNLSYNYFLKNQN